MTDTQPGHTGKVRNISGEDLVVEGRLVLAGAAFVVTETNPYGVWGYTQQETRWEPFDDAAEAVHQYHLDAIAYILAEQQAAEVAAVAALIPTEPDVDGDDVPDAQPAGNASREVWAAYVIGAHLATETDLEALSRDEIRDTYKTED